MAQAEGVDFDLEQRGILHIYRDRNGFEHAREVSKLLAEGGLPRRAATPDEMRAIEPSLQGEYHGGWQDFGFKLRYNVVPGPLTVTPFVGYNVPSHDYVFFAHTALGTLQESVSLGVDLGYRFEPHEGS